MVLGSPAFASSLDVLRSVSPEILSPARSYPLVFSTSLKFTPIETSTVGTTKRTPFLSSCSKGYTGVECTDNAMYYILACIYYNRISDLILHLTSIS